MKMGLLFSLECQACIASLWRCLTGNTDYRLQRQKSADLEAGNSVSDIDMVSRFLFPLTFSLFNLLYWLVYVYLEVS